MSMSDILKLREAIEKALTVNGFAVDHSVLDAENSALMQMLGSAGGNRPPKDRMREAVLQFRETNQLQNLAAARFVCFGAAERFGSREPPLIEERESFPRLLGLIDEYRPEPRGFRRCFRGLLHTYIAYDGEHRDTCGEGRDNWCALRDYLHHRRNDIVVQGTQPDWVECITRHSNLLTSDPASRYAADLLAGRNDAVEEIRCRLDVSDHHWLMRKLILAQIEHSTRDTDASFARKVQSLLRLLDGHEGLEDEGLGLILNRYATIVNPSLHPTLRDRSVRTWGNPWITSNRKKWARVSDAASALVTSWFKLHVIRTFFELISDDRQIDQRRVKFWEQYHEQIDDMYFALRGTTRYSSKSAVRDMCRQMGDRLLDLKGAGSNNAFIMMMGDVVAVEFGVTGHACFFYKRDSVPFSLRGEVSGSTADYGLRSSNNLERLTHVDTRSGRWEENFAHALQRHGAGLSQQRADRVARAAPLPPRSAPLNSRSLSHFCLSHGIAWIDNTQKGGNIAVRFAYNSGIVADQLKAWGFAFSVQREIWWRKTWP